MTSSPTIPAFAARVWIEDNHIHMDLPAVGSIHSHRLTFPADAQGMTRALHMLKQRTVNSKIGEAGDLTQHQVNQQLRIKVPPNSWRNITVAKSKDTFSAAARQGARDIMRKLGVMP